MQQNHPLGEILLQHEADILSDWIKDQFGSGPFQHMRSDLVREAEMRELCKNFLQLFIRGAQSGQGSTAAGGEWDELRSLLTGFSRDRALQGYTPTETANFIFLLKRSLFPRIVQNFADNTDKLFHSLSTASDWLDSLVIFTMEVYQKGREEIINRQQEEMLELSTPVVKLWDGILALPMIGTLDSARSQTVMETLLQTIMETGSKIAIIDITGVPTVDTVVAQHLMKTVAAARLMGADCIISGIRPQIAQTIVHLAIDLGGISTKATLADAFRLAMQKLGLGFQAQAPRI